MKALIKVITSFAVGAGVGAAYTYFNTPRSGAHSRERVISKFDATKKALEEAATSKLEEAKALLNQTVKNKTRDAKNMLHKVKNASSAS